MKLEKGKKAGTRKGMRHNVEVMLEAGYKPKRARGAAYGEVGMEKLEEKRESKAKKDVIKHLKKDNKECNAENKLHKKLIKEVKKAK